MPHARGALLEGGCWLWRWREQQHRQPKFLGDDADGLAQIGVIGDDSGDVEPCQGGIPDKVRAQIYIDPFSSVL